MPVGKTKLSDGEKNAVLHHLFIAAVSIVDFVASLVILLLQAKSDTLRTGEGMREPSGARVGEALRVAKWGWGYSFESGGQPPGCLFIGVGAGILKQSPGTNWSQTTQQSSPKPEGVACFQNHCLGSGHQLAARRLACGELPTQLAALRPGWDNFRAVELGTRRQLLPVRWYLSQPRNAVRGTRIFRDYLFQDESVWTRGQNCQVLKAGFRPLCSSAVIPGNTNSVPRDWWGRGWASSAHLPFQGHPSPTSQGVALGAFSLRPVLCQLRGLQLRASSFRMLWNSAETKDSIRIFPGVRPWTDPPSARRLQFSR